MGGGELVNLAKLFCDTAYGFWVVELHTPFSCIPFLAEQSLQQQLQVPDAPELVANQNPALQLLEEPYHIPHLVSHWLWFADLSL